MIFPILFSLVGLALTAPAAEPAAPTDFSFGKKLTLHSHVLNEDRPLQIFTPAAYDSDQSSYPTLPVLYLLDGQAHFVHVAGLVDFLGKMGRIPPMIVVAVGNTQRTRDFTPTHTLIDPMTGKTAEHLAASGGSGKFSEFLRDELIPYVDKNYRTAPFRILDGYSFGGLVTVKMLLEMPETFQAYLAITPSLWWDFQVMLKSTGPIGRAKQFLFITVANEGGLHRASIDRFVGQLKDRAAPGLAWSFKAYEDESHGSAPHPAIYDGLKFIFSNWDIISRAIGAEPASYAAVVQHYRDLSERFSYPIPLPLARIRDIAANYTHLDRMEEAIAVYQEAVRNYPHSSPAYTDLAGIYAKKGEKDLAIQNYRKALELDPKSETAKKALEKLMK